MRVEGLADFVDFAGVTHAEDAELILSGHFREERRESRTLVQFGSHSQFVCLMNKCSLEVQHQNLGVRHAWDTIRKHLRHSWLCKHLLYVIDTPVNEPCQPQELLIRIVLVLWSLILLNECQVIKENGKTCPGCVLERLADQERHTAIPLELFGVFLFLLIVFVFVVFLLFVFLVRLGLLFIGIN